MQSGSNYFLKRLLDIFNFIENVYISHKKEESFWTYNMLLMKYIYFYFWYGNMEIMNIFFKTAHNYATRRNIKHFISAFLLVILI